MGHIHEKIDFTVDVYIVYDEEVLLRQHDKYKRWLAPGGHIELHEDPTEAVPREAREEVGLEIILYNEDPLPQNLDDGYTWLVRPQFRNRHRINETHEHVSDIYFAWARSNNLILSETEKSPGVKWFKEHELKDPQYGLSPTIQIYAATALRKLTNEKRPF